jgi:hypothetical protein
MDSVLDPLRKEGALEPVPLVSPHECLPPRLLFGVIAICLEKMRSWRRSRLISRRRFTL